MTYVGSLQYYDRFSGGPMRQSGGGNRNAPYGGGPGGGGGYGGGPGGGRGGGRGRGT